MDTRDIDFLRQAIDLATQARSRGDEPFGALITDSAGSVLAKAYNSIDSSADITSHAEMNAVRDVWKPGIDLREATLYTSCEPCAMCSGAIFWSGIGRVVFALSGDTLISLAGGPQSPLALSLPCRSVFAKGGHEVVVCGPLLEDEARFPVEGYWN